MSEIERTYSNNWKDLGTVLAYIHDSFSFLSNVIIVDLDDCICKKVTIAKLYNAKNKHTIEFNNTLIKKLTRRSTDVSVIIMSNQTNTNKLTIDSVKLKIELLVEKTKMPILAFFALKPNSFCKPHTGMWRLLNAYYKSKSLSVRNVTVVSNAGGMFVTKETKTTVTETVGYDDYDRAFAHNIKCAFMTVSEYTDDHIESRLLPKTKIITKYEYNHNIISPDIRELYANELDKKENINIFKELGMMSAVNYLIVIQGPPRCGKTTLSNEIVTKWRNSKYGDYNAVEILYGSNAVRSINLYKKIISDRISVVLDGCDLEARDKYVSLAHANRASILFITIDIGLEMAKVLNHVYVEESKDEKIMLVKLQDFCIYRSKFKPPKESDGKHIIYYPKIDRRDTVMKFRY